MLEENYMQVALQLAKSVKGQTTPNPPVGAVVVKNGSIVGLGAHMKYGGEHAEVIALKMAGENANQATLFVTLEPCRHEGLTPPCTDYIIRRNVKRVVISCEDVNPKVSGKGIEKLRQAGIEVDIGLLKEKALQLYDVFFHQIRSKLPFVTVKAAVSLDGKTATYTRDSKWITNKKARRDVHQYRHLHDAILVGINTILLDNPRLTTRLPLGKNPLRIILDTNLRTPVDAHVVTDERAETWIFTGNQVPKIKVDTFSKRGFVRIVRMEEEKINIKHVLQTLANENISSVFVEGGATVNGSFLEQKLMNQFILYIAPIIIGGKDASSSFAGAGFKNIAESLKLHIKNVESLDDYIKIVATQKEENNVYGNS